MEAFARLGVVAIVTVALTVCTSGRSSAELRPGLTPKPGGEVVDGTPAVVIAVDGSGTELARRTYRARSSGPVWSCVYYPMVYLPGSPLGFDADRTAAITPEPPQFVMLVCSADGALVHEEYFVFDPQQPFGPAFSAGDAALLAREMLPLPDPDIATSPPLDRPQLVGLSTWLRVGDAWQTFSATATLGGVSATVTATPVEVVWDPGDGSPAITCDGPGAAFDATRPGATSDCSHTYTEATTAESPVLLTATITYDVSWTATDGSADSLEPVTRSATVPITIGQRQAVIR